MKLARENNGRPADAVTAADTAVGAKAASEEVTDGFANKTVPARAVGRAGFEPAKA